ncbi:hypothetical protein LOTGIDRAFT_168554 [Lottia gigantea]|uniref:Uncharacterized protein n=1 Tax=Lottia gigantea TaxID=225164 RepID=V3ZUS6_LOTGI|nr:hypothetical protein LOTGIDRAFT_168554 [Lottia gigantea]ESO84686.1 hypothetical protein LOTGIDRAFT_168554 [Lottia gigantea]
MIEKSPPVKLSQIPIIRQAATTCLIAATARTIRRPFVHVICHVHEALFSAETCQPQIEACGTKAREENDKGLSNCTVIDDFIDCISLIPASKCTPNDLSLLGSLFDQENRDREIYCNNYTTTTDSLSTTTDAIGCHTRAEICSTEADKNRKKGLDLCTVYTKLVNCISSIPMTGCTDRNFILQILQQQTEQQNKYCHYSLPTTTKALDCHTRAEICATEADKDSKKGLDLCTVYTNFVNCLTSIPMTGCTDRNFILQILQQQTEQQNKYCHYSLPTTTKAIDCHTRAEICATEADKKRKKGLDLCTVYTNLVNCISSIPMTGCTDRNFILQILQQQTEQQNKYCHSKSETSLLPTINVRTTQFSSTRIKCYPTLTSKESNVIRHRR